MKITHPPFAAAGLPEDWINVRRAIVQRDGYALRASAAGAAIEVKSLHHEQETWLFICLPNGGTQFATAAARDAVLAQLQGQSV